MIKINLLPPHVVERRKVRSLAKWLLLVLLVEIVGLSFYVYRLAGEEARKKSEFQEAKAQADLVRGLEEKVSAEKSAAAPFRAKLKWYDGIYKHNAKIADTLEKINEYIYAGMTVRNLSVNGDQVQISGATKDIDHVARAYLNLLRSRYMSPGSLRMSLSSGPGVPGGQSIGGMGFTAGSPAMSPMAGMGGRAPAMAMRAPMMGPMGFMGGPMGIPPGMATRSSTPTAITTAQAPNPNEAMSVQFSFALLPTYGLGAAQAGAPAGRGPAAAGRGAMMGPGGMGRMGGPMMGPRGRMMGR